VPDPIRPPLAVRPDELCHLIADALGDGDLEAALTYYEETAIMENAGTPRQVGIAAIRGGFARVIEAKLAFEIEMVEQLVGDDLAQMNGLWSMRGRDASGSPVASTGTFRSTARRQRDGGWRMALERLTTDDHVPDSGA
jgi:ketosteroid isomerase-like protein